jgi:hypothetical protein
MKYVLDSCVAFKTLLVEQDSSKAQRLCEEYEHNVHELLSPDVFPMEIASPTRSLGPSDRAESHQWTGQGS